LVGIGWATQRKYNIIYIYMVLLAIEGYIYGSFFLKKNTDSINIMKTNKSIKLYITRDELSDATISLIQSGKQSNHILSEARKIPCLASK
jgi:ribonucleotide reductase beta subunit family protein with ferritin-like domain